MVQGGESIGFLCTCPLVPFAPFDRTAECLDMPAKRHEKRFIPFATDVPYPNLMCPLKEWGQALKNPETDIQFLDEEINLILGEAERKVLKL